MLEVIPVGVGEVQLRGVETGLFLAMGKEGRLHATKYGKAEETVFVQSHAGPYILYMR